MFEQLVLGRRKKNTFHTLFKLFVDNNLKNLNIPILILHSTNLNSKTGRVPIKKNEAIPYIDFICSLSKKVNVEKFENTGHYITIEEPDKTNKIILKWLDDINLNS